jgi:hypothetical protein
VKLTLALLARYAEVDPESGLLNLTGGGVDIFGLKRLPAEFPMAYALRLRYPEAEAGQIFQIALAILDPQIQPVGKPTDFEITPRLGEYHADGGHGTYTIAGTVTLAVESPGMHSISITIDGAIAGDIPFQVFLATDE